MKRLATALAFVLSFSAECLASANPVVIGEWTIHRIVGMSLCYAGAVYGLDGNPHIKGQPYEIAFSISPEYNSQDFTYEFQITLGSLGNTYYEKWLSPKDSAMFIDDTGEEWNFQTTESSAATMLINSDLKKLLAPTTFTYNHKKFTIPSGDANKIMWAIKDCYERGWSITKDRYD